MAAVSTRFAPLPLTQPQSSCRSVSSFQGSESTKVYSLDDFVRDVKAHLGESGGVGCDGVDEDYLISLTQKYVSNPNDWARYYHNCPSKNYTRNATVNINQKANILLLVWNPGKGSPIHDHANVHCILKVLAGELTETVYNIGLHRVYNPHPTQVAVSLHLYTPPNAADVGYNVFDEATGRASFVPKAQAHQST